LCSQNTEAVLEAQPLAHQYEDRSPSPPPETEKIKVIPTFETTHRPVSPAKSNSAEQLDSLSSASDEERKEKLKISTQEKEVKTQTVQEIQVEVKVEPKIQVKASPEIEVKVELKKLPKAESFSHHSEFDVVKVKRRAFAESAGSRQAGRTTSYGSSSDEEAAAERLGGSMTDLNVNVRKLNNESERKPAERPARKAASVLGLQELAPDIQAHPELLESFQVELENQFEQWKEDFLQRHLGKTSKSGSLDSGSAHEELQQQVTLHY